MVKDRKFTFATRQDGNFILPLFCLWQSRQSPLAPEGTEVQKRLKKSLVFLQTIHFLQTEYSLFFV